MAYKKHVWENGQIITKEKLNNIQDGIAALDPGDKLPTDANDGDFLVYEDGAWDAKSLEAWKGGSY